MHPKKFAYLASTALCLSFAAAAPADAADMPVKASKAVAAPVVAAPSWAGLYVGINGGYSWGRTRATSSVEPFTVVDFSADFPGGSSTESLKLNGGVFGGQIGYIGKFAPNWYAGLEADFQWTGEKDSARITVAGFDSPCTTQICNYTSNTDLTVKLSWFGTVRGLVGTDVMNGLFVYVTGGWAYGRVKISGDSSVFATDNESIDVTFSKSFSDSVNKSGYAAGLGIKGMLGKDLFWGIEYLHLDLGSIGTLKYSDPPVHWTLKTSRVTDEILRVSLTWRLTP